MRPPAEAASATRRRVSAAVAAGCLLLAIPTVATASPTPAPHAASAEAALDTDGDGLLDVWETAGYDADGDGDIDVDLPAMGADPMHKDVFVEMDYMSAPETCPCYLPLASDLRRIVRAYARSPRAGNPDGTRGITMHLDAGSARGSRFDLGGGNLVPLDLDLNPVVQEANAIKRANFDPDRSRIFHYMIWGHGYEGGTSSGLSFGIPADDFIVTLGWFPEDGTSNAKVGTFIHELGHNLGLRHGGDDDENYKPNYLSVMQYAFQIDGVPRTAGRSGYFGYSNKRLPALVEGKLDERVGLDSPAAADFRTSWWCPDFSLITSTTSADGPLDWNCNGRIDGTVSSDLTSDGLKLRLQGARDWGQLVYDGGKIGVTSDEPVVATQVEELTAEQYEQLRSGS